MKRKHFTLPTCRKRHVFTLSLVFAILISSLVFAPWTLFAEDQPITLTEQPHGVSRSVSTNTNTTSPPHAAAVHVDRGRITTTSTPLPIQQEKEEEDFVATSPQQVSVAFLSYVTKALGKRGNVTATTSSKPRGGDVFKLLNGDIRSWKLPFTYVAHETLPSLDTRVEMGRSVMAQFFETPHMPIVNRTAGREYFGHDNGENVKNNTESAEESMIFFKTSNNASSTSIFSTANASQCQTTSGRSPVLFLDWGAMKNAVRTPKLSSKLERSYTFENQRLHGRKPSDTFNDSTWASSTFYTGPASDAHLPNHPDASVREAWARRKVDWVPTSNPHETDSYDYWADYDDEAEDGNLPCTQYIQHRLHALMNPQTCPKNPNTDEEKKKAETFSREHDPFEALRTAANYYVSAANGARGFGVGAHFFEVATDFLGAMMVGRVFLSRSGRRWRFSSDHCASAGRSYLDCYWQHPSHCQYKLTARTAQALPLCNLTTGGMQAGEVFARLNLRVFPSDEEFFGRNFVRGLRNSTTAPSSSSTPPRIPKCYQRFKDWIYRDLSHTHLIHITFDGADPRTHYMVSQVMRYLTRYQQPWFYNMLSQGLGHVGMGWRGVQAGPRPPPSPPLPAAAESNKSNTSDAVVAAAQATRNRKQAEAADISIFIHERSEAAKFKECFAIFGCHHFHSSLLADLVLARCASASGDLSLTNNNVTRSFLATAEKPSCHVYVSGNAKHSQYKWFVQTLTNGSAVSALPPEKRLAVTSTWDLLSREGVAWKETSDYGANSPSAEWIDLYAGVSSSHWICFSQSNWCRIINWLRLTAGRAVCGGFLDLGTLAISSKTIRKKYCVIDKKIGTDWCRHWGTRPKIN